MQRRHSNPLRPSDQGAADRSHCRYHVRSGVWKMTACHSLSYEERLSWRAPQSHALVGRGYLTGGTRPSLCELVRPRAVRSHPAAPRHQCQEFDTCRTCCRGPHRPDLAVARHVAVPCPATRIVARGRDLPQSIDSQSGPTPPTIERMFARLDRYAISGRLTALHPGVCSHQPGKPARSGQAQPDPDLGSSRQLRRNEQS